ncbi:A/G-specific adenine glycosylase [Pseudidiomarina gelatinasegens]|jgi:A/G-specific adenine glycosylase|uniref:Adenine DNA glycosylase n=1 Tax=Pseudidiomarina gelatinasegens TaxID=2487740 RepID=A0A451GF75_9GAMM|nr:A/G-specific adenine glycosylase [Pseudidiomarina gelatinasegens]RWU11789.1 A/G-specific adenine glycosylase [Pseudidiomarina gelatinasegens]|tara:strand:- start:1489 stop:2508 length:1020 start_codon:yes stop_codon:yes gene_type:complete
MINKTSQDAITPLLPKEFAHTIITWQHQHGRNTLPWQREASPYHVLVSELMLQQTQVSTVIPYFERWIKVFPDLATLAQASEDQVLAQWQGLGYYSRARNLHKAAGYVMTELNGQLPATPESLREVPGVGPYTAGAITAFAFDKPAAIVDGNVKRLFCRYFGINGDPNSSAINRQIWTKAEEYKPHSNSRQYAQALLDLGATICTPRNPKCELCPLQQSCNALATDRVNLLPQKRAKRTLPTKDGYFALDVNANGVILVQRSANGIWPRLWCLPELSELPPRAQVHGSFKHVFSHYRLNATVINCTPSHATTRIPLEALAQYGLPAPIRKYIHTHVLEN